MGFHRPDQRIAGVNEGGQAGRGTYTPYELEPQVVSGGHAFARLYAGVLQACALATGGGAWCWGENSFAQLGFGFNGGLFAQPTAVVGGNLFGALAKGATHTCGINATGIARCWGQNTSGALANPDPATATSPTVAAAGVTFFSW